MHVTRECLQRGSMRQPRVELGAESICTRNNLARTYSSIGQGAQFKMHSN